MYGWAFNWGSEGRSAPAELMRGQVRGEFDWVCATRGKGWDKNDRSADASGHFKLPLLFYVENVFIYFY